MTEQGALLQRLLGLPRTWQVVVQRVEYDGSVGFGRLHLELHRSGHRFAGQLLDGPRDPRAVQRGSVGLLLEAPTTLRDRLVKRFRAPDQRMLADAAQEFSVIVKRYSSSEYAVDAQKRLRFLTEQMVKHDLEVARYYVTRKSYPAAITRVKHLLAKYPQTTLRKPALELLAEAYLAQGNSALHQATQEALDAL